MYLAYFENKNKNYNKQRLALIIEKMTSKISNTLDE